MICDPIIRGREYVCRNCGWGAGKRFAKSFRRNCHASSSSPLTPHPFSQRALILVLGLHCSLSSCLAGVLERLGVWMGANTTGGEDPKLATLLESLMPFPGVDLRMHAAKPCSRVRVFRELVERYLVPDAAGKPMGLKYPTLCRFAGELQEAWPSLRIVHVARPLSESIASLTDRSAAHPDPRYLATADECDRLQRHLAANKEQFLATRSHLTVHADDLLRDPAGEVDRLSEYLGLSPSDDQRRQAIAHVDPARARHSRGEGRGLFTKRGEGTEWMAETTILVKTHQRPEKLRRLVESILSRYPGARILVADDSPPGQEPGEVAGATVYQLPFDVGLSAGRNFLVDQAETPLVLILDDDFRFTARTNIDALWRAMRDQNLNLAAGEAACRGRPPLVGWFELAGDRLILHRGLKQGTGDRGQGTADWVPNFFLARTETLRRCRWDDRLKVGEHQDFFLRAWRAGLLAKKIGYVPECVVEDDNAAGDCSSYRCARRRDRTYYRQAMTRWARRLGVSRYHADTHSLDFSGKSGPAEPLPTIPTASRLIHQIWIGPDALPEQFRPWVDLWRLLNPDWTHRLWSEGEAMPLLWPNLVPLYHRATSWAQKSDFLRLAILHYHGGLYLDTDFEPLHQRPLGDLLDQVAAFVSIAARDGQLCNGVLGATPQHPLIGELLRAIPKHFDPAVGSSIGPRMVMSVMARLRETTPDLVDDVATFPQHYFLPIQYTEREKLQTFEPADWPDSYAVHHFAASWRK